MSENTDCPICTKPIQNNESIVAVKFGRAGQAFQIEGAVHALCLWDLIKNPVKNKVGPFVTSLMGRLFGEGS